MATLTIQPSDKDAMFSSGSPTTNFGSETWLQVSAWSSSKRRSALEFDIPWGNGIGQVPLGATIVSATLSLYYYSGSTGELDPAGRTYYAYRLTNTAWVEGEATWARYSAPTNWWSTPGGDYTGTDVAGASVPASYGWMAWNVLAQVQTAQSGGINAEFLVKDSDETVLNLFIYAMFYSNNAGGGYLPKLVIEHSAIYELSCSDGLKAGDSIQHNCPDVADGVKLSDALIDNIIFNSVSASDGVLLGDVTSTYGLYALLLLDGLKISDLVLHDYITNPTLIDGVKLSESLSTWLQSYPTIIDGVKLSEVLTTLKETFPTLTDGAKLSDVVAHYLTLSLLASDGIKLSDAVTHYLTLSLSATDGAKLSDLASIHKAMVIYALLELYSRALIARLHKRDTTVIQEE